MSRKETLFKQWLCSSWEKGGGWVERYEPRKGGGTGIADIQLIVGGRLIPVELKIATLNNNSGWILYSEDVRASQIGWHKRLSLFNQKSFFLWAVFSGNKPKRLFVGTINEAIKWKQGIPIRELNEVATISELESCLKYICQD